MSASAEDPAASGVDIEHLAAVLVRRRRELAGGTAVIGASGVVHRVHETVWAGVRVPATACRAASDPLRLRPAHGPVTCRRCLRRTTGRDTGVPEGQTELSV
ncbi:hypothetical protein HNR12_002904 [Streptomonospora nanhaiensis]|uniref:Uncharacterized protein n=1 Tax=Streptomonospora nanhaiensis TaxID=1323731 RepID=A0A853BPV0_9ACTN|nr:hypothetical protein [Streptomonospora nanhaiensis]NYI96627.1 hypothetical protein [Streptomonospora nanhaiensis]